LLLDTSGLLCYLHRAETQHQKAVQLLDKANSNLWIQSYVLAELIALASVRGVPRASVLAFSIDLLENPDITVVWINQQLHQAGMQLLIDRPDKGYSLCDAVSFVLMRQHNITEALTTDRHFEQEGFIRLL
jgi:uncharacterized protein